MKKLSTILKAIIVTATLGVCLTGLFVTLTAPAHMNREHAADNQVVSNVSREEIRLTCSRGGHTVNP